MGSAEEGGQNHIRQYGLFAWRGKHQVIVQFFHTFKHPDSLCGERCPVLDSCFHPVTGNGPYLFVKVGFGPSYGPCLAGTTGGENDKQLLPGFYSVLKTKNKSRLNQWLSDASMSGVVDLHRVAYGMKAIHEEISSEWSNATMEGHINRLKKLKC